MKRWIYWNSPGMESHFQLTELSYAHWLRRYSCLTSTSSFAVRRLQFFSSPLALISIGFVTDWTIHICHLDFPAFLLNLYCIYIVSTALGPHKTVHFLVFFFAHPLFQVLTRAVVYCHTVCLFPDCKPNQSVIILVLTNSVPSNLNSFQT